VSDISEVFVTC